jgi:hypothetical protein
MQHKVVSSRRCNLEEVKNFAPVKRSQLLSNFALLLEEVGSQTVGPPYRYQQLTPLHGLKMDENSLHSTFQESLAVGLNF